MLTTGLRCAQGAPTILKQSSTNWKLYRDKPEPVNTTRRQPNSQQDTTPWLLEDRAGNLTHKGQLEGGINPDNYFLLVKQHGSFTAHPLAAWYNFKPPPRRVAMSLEEAEAEMEKKHNSHFSGTSRLGQAIARNEGMDDSASIASRQAGFLPVRNLRYICPCLCNLCKLSMCYYKVPGEDKASQSKVHHGTARSIPFQAVPIKHTIKRRGTTSPFESH